ncbi:hypothetical protein QOZ98_000032 [Planomicrobium stackebrandtii]|uniref:Uncharacterized protein n=1 Tax=Planomicrobium stackebrandtii TaxID=253160 RepID=A0ABU0GRL0_9BACL|nr:hypothetical protein [Planomicrobium stackebrandtii]
MNALKKTIEDPKKEYEEIQRTNEKIFIRKNLSLDKTTGEKSPMVLSKEFWSSTVLILTLSSLQKRLSLLPFSLSYHWT